MVLFQGTEAERDAALEELRNRVGNEEAAQQLQPDSRQDGDQTIYFVKITGDEQAFRAASPAANDIADLITMNESIEFGVTDQNLPGKGGTTSGAYTYRVGEIGNNNVRVLVNPTQVSNSDHINRKTIGFRWKFQNYPNSKYNWIRAMTTGTAIWHEFGHAKALVRNMPDHQGESLKWENRMRKQTYGPLGEKNRPRVKH